MLTSNIVQCTVQATFIDWKKKKKKSCFEITLLPFPCLPFPFSLSLSFYKCHHVTIVAGHAQDVNVVLELNAEIPGLTKHSKLAANIQMLVITILRYKLSIISTDVLRNYFFDVPFKPSQTCTLPSLPLSFPFHLPRFLIC